MKESEHTLTSFQELEYKALRDEILQRMRFRFQITTICLTLGGVFIGASLRFNQPLLLFFYPPIAAFLAIAWRQNDAKMGLIGDYIATTFEQENGWQHFLKKRHGLLRAILGRVIPLWFGLSATGMQVCTLFLFWSQTPYTPKQAPPEGVIGFVNTLAYIDVFSILVVIGITISSMYSGNIVTPHSVKKLRDF